MKKTLLALLTTVIAFAAIQPAQAEDQKVLAIIDTAIDSNKVASVIQEVCFTDSASMPCPNRQNFMEGKGAASSTVWPTSMLNATYHGHNMVQVALAADPTVKVVFVRVANISSVGNSSVTTNTLSRGIEWVSQNAAKYSIDAVSISQSSSSKNNLDACTGVGSLKDQGVRSINAIASLSGSNIPVFIATGNDGSKTTVGFPACIDKAVGVGSVRPNLLELSSLTNRGVGLDLVSLATVSIVNYKGNATIVDGTSSSTAYAAAYYVKNNNSKPFAEFLNALPKVLGYSFINK